MDKEIIIQQKNFLAKWNLSSKELSKVKRIQDVFLIKTPGLAEINKEYGNDFLISYLSIWISKINSFAGGNMNTEDCKNTALFIFEDFYFLTIADLKLISKSLRLRKFIRVTGNEIYREVEIYFNKRCEFASDYSKKESDDNKTLSVGSEVLNDKELKQYYKDVKDGKKLSEAPKDIERNCNKIDRKHKEFRERYEDEN